MAKIIWPMIKSLSINSVKLLARALVRSSRFRYGEALPLFDENAEEEGLHLQNL